MGIKKNYEFENFKLNSSNCKESNYDTILMV